MEENKVEEEVWTMIDEWKATKDEKVHYDLDCSEYNVHHACLVDMAEVLVASFGY